MDDEALDTAGAPREDSAAYWMSEIKAARDREKDYRKNGQQVIDIYSGAKVKSTPFNILFSNTETMAPALYSATPRPVVQRRFKDEDPLGKAVAQAGVRMLEYLADTNFDGYDTFDEGMKGVTMDALLPGRGVLTVKYDSELGQFPPKEEGDDPVEYKKSELVCVDRKIWNRVVVGYAKKWSTVPWIAYEEHIDEDEAERLFGKEKASKIIFDELDEDDPDKSREKQREDKNSGMRKTALVYQIWDKHGGRKIRWVSPHYQDGVLRTDDDPLELSGFFNCPRPLQFIEKIDDICPVAIYELYRNQATELNDITRRLNHVIRAIKAKALYDSELGEDVKRLLESDDNEFVPADKSSSLAAEKGLQNAIWFMPVEQLVNVAEKLILAREQCKQVIYEIMGISDILRGASKASETLGAQKIKQEWGGLRLKPKQKEVQRYSRDMFRLMLEVAASKFEETTWAAMTGLPFVTTDQRARLESTMQQVQLQAQAMAAAGQQPSPQQMQQLQQLQMEMQKPVWGKVLEVLRDDVLRSYRVDIETNSTVEPEAVEDQKNIAEVMTALGQFLNGITPLVVNGSMPFQAAQAMMLAITRRFRFGPEIEDYIKAMQPPKPPDDGKDKAAADATQKAAAQAQKFEQEKTQGLAQIESLKAQLQAEKQARDMDRREAAVALREAKVQIDEERLRMAEQTAMERVNTKDQVLSLKQSTTDKVRSIQDAAQKREQQTQKDAGGKIEQAVASTAKLADAVSNIEQYINDLADKLEKIGGREVIAVDRVKGEDGRLAKVVRRHADGTNSEVAVNN